MPEGSPNAPLLETRGLSKHFPLKGRDRGRVVRAVDDVSLTLAAGETLGLVGESGCGKSTVGRALLRLIEPTSGRILLAGTDVTELPMTLFRPYRKQLQIVFQDPFSSLNPRHRVEKILTTPLIVHSAVARGQRRERVVELLERVGLRAADLRKFPHEFSGGQRQRIGIARALALNPSIIVCDEAVSALDVSVQAQIINLLGNLQRELGVAYLFISHDLAVVEHISHRVAVMYLGQIVETADCAQIFGAPKHPYTEALLGAVPMPYPQRPKRPSSTLAGEVPSPIDPPPGCRFHTRCPIADRGCSTHAPPLREVAGGGLLACHKR
ncbi:MAG: ABC transporter ATP-binding protein [Alphaproteobacteria bacterium]